MWHCPSEGQDLAQSTRAQAPGPPTRKPIQKMGPNSPPRGRHQQQEELRLQKGDLKHSKLDKMRTWRNMLQMEQRKNPQNEVNKEEIGNLPEKECKIIIVNMTQISEIEYRGTTEWRKYNKYLTRT